MSSYAYLAHTAANSANGGSLSAATADNMFAIMTLNAELSDPDALVTLSSNGMVFASTGTYQIDAMVAFGYDAAMNGVGFKAGLYDVTGGSFVTQKDGSAEIISSAGVVADPSASTGNAYVQVIGRFDVSNVASTYALYGAGKSVAGAWFSASYAQGSAAIGVTAGNKPEYYKLVQITKE
jgi:hypothetical protein